MRVTVRMLLTMGTYATAAAAADDFCYSRWKRTIGTCGGMDAGMDVNTTTGNLVVSAPKNVSAPLLSGAVVPKYTISTQMIGSIT